MIILSAISNLTCTVYDLRIFGGDFNLVVWQ